MCVDDHAAVRPVEGIGRRVAVRRLQRRITHDHAHLQTIDSAAQPACQFRIGFAFDVDGRWYRASDRLRDQSSPRPTVAGVTNRPPGEEQAERNAERNADQQREGG